MQDAPGWGDDIDMMHYLRTITGFLLEQRSKVRLGCMPLQQLLGVCLVSGQLQTGGID